MAVFHESRAEIRRLVEIARTLESCDSDGAPDLALIKKPEVSGSRIGFQSGSFNPPHIAHVELARAAINSGACDSVIFLISKRTVDKERPTGMRLTDRLFLLERVAEEGFRLGVALTNRGLYVDQAKVLTLAWERQGRGQPESLTIVLGFDKLVQIFDPRYYEDRDQALEQLFSLARIAVAPRGGADDSSIGALLARPENARFAEGITVIHLAPELADLSSSDLRNSGEKVAESDSTLPEAAEAFLGAYPLYLSGGDPRYELRADVIECLARSFRPEDWLEQTASLLSVGANRETWAELLWAFRTDSAALPANERLGRLFERARALNNRA